MPDAFDDCNAVSPECPVSATTYGYAPNLGGNAIYAVIFAVCALVQLFFTWKHWRTWKGFSMLTFFGCLGEFFGYVGRLFLHKNPWSGAALPIQLLLLMVAPSFLAAALYTILRRLVSYFGQEHTRLPERFWTWPFVTADLIGFGLQCGGGLVSAMGEKNPSLAKTGNTIMIFGVSFQGVIMLIAGILTTDFALRVRRRQGSRAQVPKDLKIFLSAMAVAFILILTRCIYRIPEMAGGVGGPLMRKEADFMILDGLMIVIAVILQSVVHPGPYASALQTPRSHKYELKLANMEASSQDIEYNRTPEPYGHERGYNYQQSRTRPNPALPPRR